MVRKLGSGTPFRSFHTLVLAVLHVLHYATLFLGVSSAGASLTLGVKDHIGRHGDRRTDLRDLVENDESGPPWTTTMGASTGPVLGSCQPRADLSDGVW